MLGKEMKTMTRRFNEKQKEALKTISKNVLLSAGAGSGKTEVLSNRFVQIIEEGINASNILSITFTIKAAAEMRTRIARNIRDLINAQGELYDDNGWLILKSKYDMDYWNNQLVDLQSAQVSTIHSLCARILKENPVEAKLAPGTGVLEEEDSLAFEDNCFNGFIRDAISSGNADVKFLLEKYSLYGFQSQLKGLLKYKNEILGYGENREESLKKLLDRYDVVPKDRVECFIVKGKQFINNVGLGTFKNKKGEELKGVYLDRANNLKNYLIDYVKVLEDKCIRSCEIEGCFDTFGDSKDYPLLRNALRDLMGLYKYIKAYADRDVAKKLLPYWFKVIEAFVAYREAQRQEVNVLTFGDLERKAIELLDNNTAIRDKYHKMFRFIMVDEFQDTNEQQKQLVYLLYGNSKYKLDKSVDVPEKNLFVVGDPKQSIYRFRNADVKVFHKVCNDIKNGDLNNPGVSIEMNTNYRSHKNIVDICNVFFPDVMGEDKSQPVHYDPLEAGLDNEGAKVELITVAKPATGTGKNGGVVAVDKRKAEAEVLARKILELKADGVSFSKMTILLRAMTHVDAITDALQVVGIPYVVSGGKGFYKRPEVQDLICIFKACYSKYNVLELSVALKSPFLSLDNQFIDETLVTQLALKGNLWDSLQKQVDNPVLRNAAKKLNAIQDKIHTLGLAEVWKFIWQELEVEKTLLGMKDSSYRLANANKLYDEALSFANNIDGNISEWLKYIDKVSGDDRIKDQCADVIADNAVTIMTIHGSKGLKFDYTFVPMLDVHNNQVSRDPVLFTDDAGLGIKVPDSNYKLQNSIVYLYAADDDLAKDNEERARLLYVAMTRAAEKLILSGVSDDDDGVETPILGCSWLKQLSKINVKDSEKILEPKGSVKYLESIKDKLSSWMNGIKPKAIVKSEKKVKYPLVEKLDNFDSNGISTFTPSSLQCYSHCHRQFYYQYIMRIPGLLEKSEEGTVDENGDFIPKQPKLHEYRGELEASQFGNLLHRALELFANSGCKDELLDECFEQSKEDNQIDNATNYGKAKEMLKQYVFSSLYGPIREAAINGRCMNELKFAFYINDNFRLSGIMDCVYFDVQGKLHIVDFKTGHYHDENDGYGMQLALYKKVAETLYGVNVVSADLHYLPDLKTWSLENQKINFLEKAKDNVEDIQKYKEAEDFEVNTKNCYNCKYSWLCDQK